MSDIKEVLADSYRQIINDYFKEKEESLGNVDKLSTEAFENSLAHIMEKYSSERQNVIERWGNTPLEALQGVSPAQTIEKMDNLDDVFELFIYMAHNSDEEIPNLLIEKLKEFGQDAVLRLVQLARNSTGENEQAYLDFHSAVKTLGEMKLEESIAPLIELAYEAEEQEIKLEHIQEALRNLGKRAIDPILNQLENKEFGNVESMLIYVLSILGRQSNDDRIYRQLRKAFRSMDDKIPAVLSFTVFEDGRAVPMLRNYLEKNKAGLPENVFYEILGAIQKLGGTTTDLIEHRGYPS